MESTLQKHFAVVIDLANIKEINGEFQNLDNAYQRENFINQFFMKRYGEGKGKLEIIQKESKIKLLWLQPVVNDQADKLHQEALRFAKNRQYREAISRWVKAISQNPLDPDYYFNLGIAFFEIKNFQESIENLKHAIEVCPIYYKSHLILGTVFLKVRQYENAEKYLRESLVFYPQHSLAYLNLGAVYSILKRYDEGIKMFLKSLQISPKEVRAHFGLAKIYSIQGNVNKANKYFKNVIEIDTNRQLTNHAKRAMLTTPEATLSSQNSPTSSASGSYSEPISADTEQLYLNGYSAFLFTDYDKAIRMYELYLKKKPGDDFVWFSLGESYLRCNQILRAVDAFKKAIQINPNKGLYYKELAIAFDYLNKENEVLECVTQAHKLGKNDSITNTLMGKYLNKQQKFNEAIEHLENALKQNPNNLLAKLNLAIANIESNQKDIAINQLQEIIKATVNSPLKMKAESILETL